MAKRVNKRFLVILTTVVLVAGVAGMGVMYALQTLNKKNPQELVTESERLEKLGNVEDAIVQYQGAAASKPQDPGLRVGLGDLYNRHVSLDPQNLGKARQAWESALGVDPTYKPALERMLDSNWAYMLVSPQAQIFTSVRESATRLLAVEPQNLTAQARLNIAIIRQAQANVTTKPGEVDKSIKALWELAKKDRANAELPFWAVQGEAFLAIEASRRVSDLPEAREAVSKLAPEIASILDGQETNALMQFRAAQLYTLLPSLEAAVQSGSTTAPSSRPSKAPLGGAYNAQVTAGLTAAYKYAKPTDTNYVEIHLANFEWLRVLGKLDEARKLFDELVAKHGEDPTVRLAYARAFRQDPERRDKVLELLARPVSLEGVSGVDALRRIELKSTLKLELANLRLAALDNERDQARRKEVIDSVAADARQLEQSMAGQTVQLMELKGRVALLQGKLPVAITLLQQAADLRGENNPNFESILLLANAYLATGQTGQSEKLLRQIVTRAPEFTPGRAMWISVLMSDGRTDEARERLAEFKKSSPDAKEIPGLEALVEGGKTREEFVSKMAETTPAERVRKAAALRGEGKTDEAIALADAAFKEDPKFLPAVEQLVEMYMASDRRDEALAVASAALKANPENEQLKKLPDKLAKRTPEEFEQWRLEQIKQEPDAVTRELRFYEFYLQKAALAGQQRKDAEVKKQAAEAEAHLAAAEKLKPGDVNVDSRRFEFLLQQRRFDEAGGALLQRLAAANGDSVNGQLFRYRLAMAKNDLGAAEAAARDITRQRRNSRLDGSCSARSCRHRAASARRSPHTPAPGASGRNYEALKGLTEIYYNLDEITQAKALLDRARDSFPNDPQFREAALNHELQYGDPFKAVAERERLLKEKPDVPGNALALAETYLRAMSFGADPKTAEQTVVKARKVLEEGMKKWPDNHQFEWPLAQVMLAQNDFLGGEVLLKEYVARPDVDKTEAEMMLAEYYTRANKPAMAEQSLRDALQKSNGASRRQTEAGSRAGGDRSAG